MTKTFAATLAALTIAAMSPCASASADALWEACKAQPTRACVLAIAAADVAAEKDPYEKASALTDLGAARLKAGLRPDADQDFAAAEQAADQAIGDVMRGGALDELAIALARAGEIDAATRVEQRIGGGYPDQGWAAIAVATGKAGQSKPAEAIVAQAFERTRALSNNDYLTFGALRAVAEAQRALGLTEAAVETERLALKAALTGPDPKRHDYDLGRLAAEQATAGDFEAALRTAGLIEEPWVRASAVLDAERAAAAAGKLDEAARIADSVEAPVRLRALSLLAWQQFKAGGADRAAETLARARSIVTATADGLEKARNFAQIAVLEAEVGDAKAADADFAQARAALAGPRGRARQSRPHHRLRPRRCGTSRGDAGAPPRDRRWRAAQRRADRGEPGAVARRRSRRRPGDAGAGDRPPAPDAPARRPRRRDGAIDATAVAGGLNRRRRRRPASAFAGTRRGTASTNSRP